GAGAVAAPPHAEAAMAIQPRQVEVFIMARRILLVRRVCRRRRPTGTPAMRAYNPPMARPVRRLLRSRGFSALVIGILALGLGAALAVLEVADAVLLRPLPFARPEAIVIASQVNGGTPITVDGADFLDWRAQATAFERMAAVSARAFTLTGADL